MGALAAASALVVVVVAACGQATGVAPSANGPVELRVEVAATVPHDEQLFTQGLEIADGVLYEGTGLVGESVVRATALEPGARPGRILEQVALPAPLFGEGITVVGDRIWQLTWTNEVAIERDRATLAELRRVHYDGEGWGLCHDGRRLVASDGSDRLTFRDPVTFAPTGSVAVRRDGRPVDALNELECVDGEVWANVWQTDRIVRIDPGSGAVTGVVDASGLLEPAQRQDAGVLNGIAAVPGTDQFLITGKNWPSMFLVRFVPV
ncbi:MAG: glutaminyl-peptide cyclotransferase [Pseudonocardiaceae bacterium]|nr:glutaminyl-peptide cyclotransferase [Pseudonocardiaceae bacterium]